MLDIASEVFAPAVPGGFVWLCQVLVAAHLIRIHGRVGRDILFETTLQLVVLPVVDGFGTNFAGRAIQDADNRVLANHTSLPDSLGGMLILRFTTDLGFVDLDRSEYQTVLAIGERGANAMSQVPGGLLTVVAAETRCPHKRSASFPTLRVDIPFTYSSINVGTRVFSKRR